MKLSNIESRKLLPRFASKITWLMDALDSIIKPISERVKSIDAPLTLEAIAALTDEELETLYNQYGVAQYYPELSRSTRDLMLYEMCKIYRYLGTPHAIELLCNYIFDNVPLNVHVIDNLAFDEHGTLIDASLLDVFDIEVNPDLPVLSVDATARLFTNIIRFSRNSQALRSIVYTFIQDFALLVSPCKRTGNPQSTQTWPQDSLCVPYTPPTPSYTEITLYMLSGNKQAQSGITSSFTGNVNSTYCYPLYTDAECTTRWNGYDYSNDYELGRYVDGVWTPYIRQSVSGMPASTTENNDYVFGRILLDTGALWHVTNYQLTGTTSNLNPIIRIYPKAQQHYAGYLAYNNVYNDTTITTATKGFYPKPTNGSQTNTSGWFFTFPKATITRLLMSAGNEAQSVSGDKIAASTIYRMIFRQASAISRTFRAIEYTLDRPTLHAWLKADHTNKSTTSAGLNNLYDDDGNLLMFDGDTSAVYVPIGLYTATGANCNNNMNTLERSKFGRRSSGEWCFIQNYASVSIARVWYVKYTDCKVAYFNANKSNYTWTQGTTRVLYDANGNQIPYDSTKTYTIIQLRDSSHSVITPTFGDLALKSLINNAGNLACNAASGGTYSSLSVASVWYLEE